ncbi:MAG: MFS transporter [Actinomycetes bacterium]
MTRERGRHAARGGHRPAHRAEPARRRQTSPARAGEAPPAGDPTQDRPDPRRWRALAVCLVAGFMTLLDVSIVNVALPSIREGLSATPSDLQWIVSGYALTFGLVLVPSGRLGDARGRRTMFVVGVALFTLSSLAAGLAPSAGWLVAARLLQGVGGGVINPQVSGLIQELFRGAERGKAFGLLGATIGVSTAVGPVVGGLIIDLLGADTGWRWIFFVNLPIGAAAIALAFRLIPRPRRAQTQREDLDPLGVVLLGAGVIAMLLPLVQEQQWRGGGKWALVGVGAVVLGLFVAWELQYAARGRTPLVDMSLFHTETYSAGAAIATLYFSGFTSIFFILALHLQNGLGYSPLLAGLALTPFAAGSSVAAALGGRNAVRFGRPLVVIGLVLVVVGLLATDVVLGRVDGGSAGWAIAAPMLVGGIGSGLVISPNVTLTLAEVPVARAGTAGGMLQTGQRMGTAAGIALVGSVYFAALASSHGNFVHAASLGLRVAVLLTCVALVAGVVDLVTTARRRRAEEASSLEPSSSEPSPPEASSAAVSPPSGRRARTGPRPSPHRAP